MKSEYWSMRTMDKKSEIFAEFERDWHDQPTVDYYMRKYNLGMYEVLDLFGEYWRNKSKNVKVVECNVFDQCEVHDNCTVEVLSNSLTGEVSVGWWKNYD